MRSLIAGSVALAAVLCLCLASTASPARAQANGDTLGRQADKVKAAILTGTAEELFNAHAPWMQDRARLMHEEMQETIAESLAGSKEEVEAVNREITEGVTRYDPNGQLGVKTAKDVQALTPEKLHALFWGFYCLRGNEALNARLTAKWYQVEREVTEEILPNGDGPVGSYKSRTVGKVEYRNAQHRDRITIEAVAEGTSWHITQVDFRIADYRPLEPMGLMTSAALRTDSGSTAVLEAKRAEGEQILGSARNMARVYYAKHGSAPAKVEDCGARLEDYEGRYFQLRNKVLKKPDAERGGIVVEPVKDAGDLGFGLITFNYTDGEAEISWYDTEAELDEAIKAFETAK